MKKMYQWKNKHFVWIRSNDVTIEETSVKEYDFKNELMSPEKMARGIQQLALHLCSSIPWKTFSSLFDRITTWNTLQSKILSHISI